MLTPDQLEALPRRFVQLWQQVNVSLHLEAIPEDRSVSRVLSAV